MAVFRNYFNFPLVVLLRVARKSRGDITARGNVAYVYTYTYVYVYVYMHVQLARCITSFGRRRRLLDISRFLFFPLAPHSRLPFYVAASVRDVPMHVCIIHAHMFVFERALCSTCRGSLPMHANPVSELSKCTRKCITRTWERRRMERVGWGVGYWGGGEKANRGRR